MPVLSPETTASMPRASTFRQTWSAPIPHTHCLHSLSISPFLLLPQVGDCAWSPEWWSAGVVVCLEQGADLHMIQLMPLPLTVTCFSKIQIGFTFLVVAHLGSAGKKGR